MSSSAAEDVLDDGVDHSDRLPDDEDVLDDGVDHLDRLPAAEDVLDDGVDHLDRLPDDEDVLDDGVDHLDRPPAAEDVLDDGVDRLDRLSDDILLLIFNQIGDVEDLGRCSAVSRRFHALIPRVENIVIGINWIVPAIPIPSPAPTSDNPHGHHHPYGSLDLRGLTRIPAPDSKPFPAEVLHNFRKILHLRLGLPFGEISVDGVLLKWSATFGSSLETCVVIYASSVLSSAAAAAPSPIESGGGDDSHSGDASDSGDDGHMPEAFFTDGRLKHRFLCTVFSLFAAWVRHYILQPIIAGHYDTLQSLDVTDADGQGVLTMDRRQLQELLQVPPVYAPGPTLLIPAFEFRLWYTPRLDLPGGIVLEGPTLVVVRPSEEWTGDTPGGQMDWVCSVFEEPYRTAARMLLKRRCYCGQQMNL